MKQWFPLSLFLVLTLLFSACGPEIAMNCDGTVSELDDFVLCMPNDMRMVSQKFGEEDSIVIQYYSQDDGMSLMRAHVKKDPILEPVQNHLEFAERAVSYARDTAVDYIAISTEPIEVNRKQSILQRGFVTACAALVRTVHCACIVHHNTSLSISPL